MNPRDSESVLVVRVDAHAAIVADVDLPTGRVRRALRFPGGMDAIDGLVESLVLAAAKKTLDAGRGADGGGAGDRDRLRRDVAAARIRLVAEDSTTVAIRRSGRTVFVPLERSSVIAVLASGTAAVARGLTTLDGTPDSRVVHLDGVDAVPGLLEALPGRLTSPVGSEAHYLGALLDATYAAEPALPTPSRTSRPVTVLRRAWPGAVAVVLLLAVGGTAAAMNLSGRPAGGHPATTTARPDEAIENAADRSATPTPSVSVTPSATQLVPTGTATPAKPKTPARSTGGGSSNPGSGAGAAPGQGAPADPGGPVTQPTAPPSTDPPSADPTPSDPPPTDPSSLG